MICYLGIEFNLDFVEGEGGIIPAAPGIYAEIHWPTKSLRIGESGNMRARNRQHLQWARKHLEGSHNDREARRQGDIVELAKKWGTLGLEHFVMSDDPRLANRELRVECEKWLHLWAQQQTRFENLNRQKGYRTVR